MKLYKIEQNKTCGGKAETGKKAAQRGEEEVEIKKLYGVKEIQILNYPL